MKKIEQFEIGEIVHPPFDGFHADNGTEMFPHLDYSVKRFLKDHLKRFHGPFSVVTVTDAHGLDYPIEYGRLVVGRLEDFPSLRELMSVSADHWNNRSREKLVEAYKADVSGYVPKTHFVRRRRTIRIDREVASLYVLKATTRPSPQRTALVSLISEAASKDGMVQEHELVEFLSANQERLLTKQPAMQIYNWHKSDLVRAGVLRVLEEDPNEKGGHE